MTAHAPRCEPPEGLRDRDGWHWVEFEGFNHPTHGKRPVLMATQWWDRRHDNCWSDPFTLRMIWPENMAKKGYRYIAPVPTPDALAALVRAAREARDWQQRRAAGLVTSAHSTVDDLVLAALHAALAPFKDIPHG